MQRQQNLINDLKRAADVLQNLNTNASTQQLQTTQQHEYLQQASPTNPPALNCVALSNKTTASSKFHILLYVTNLLFYIVFVIFIFSLLFFVGTLFSV